MSPTGTRPSSELLIYSDQKQDRFKKRIKIDEIVNILLIDAHTFSILLNNSKILQFKAEMAEAHLCWVAELKAALSRGNPFLFTQ